MLLLRITTPYFVAGAVWEGGRCVRAAPIIKWLIGMAPAEAKAQLVRRGYQWEWM